MSIIDNAVLVRIETPAATGGAVELDPYGDPDTEATQGGWNDVWTGSAPVYLKRIDRTVFKDGVAARIQMDVLWILDSTTAPVVAVGGNWETSRVTVIDKRTSTPQTRTFLVNAAEHRAAGTDIDHTRLELDTASG